MRSTWKRKKLAHRRFQRQHLRAAFRAGNGERRLQQPVLGEVGGAIGAPLVDQLVLGAEALVRLAGSGQVQLGLDVGLVQEGDDGVRQLQAARRW